MQELVFGSEFAAVTEKRIVTVQAIGGTGGLKIGADFLRQIAPQSEVWISDPSWENHRQLFEAAGFTVRSYPYYDPRTKGLDLPGMRNALDRLPAGAIVVLHACCHNPTGVDLSPENWSEILAIVQRRGLIPFLDLAYQGFGDGLDSDALAARLFGGAMSPVFLSTSFSKSLSLYGERVGAFSLVTASPEEAARAPELRALWNQELGAMRERIKQMRRELVNKIKQRAPGVDLSSIVTQRGLFSYTGLTKEQVQRLRKEYSIYAIETGRICVAALNSGNIDYVAQAIAKVIQ